MATVDLPPPAQDASERRAERLLVLSKSLAIIGSLYFFLVGIQGIGEAFKLFGADLANQILTTTANPFTSLFIGILSTTLVQSSSTTTSIIVGMVAGGGLTLQGAVPMIMGANIGTTVTNCIVSIGHITRGNEFQRAFSASVVHDFFNVITVAIIFPLELATGFLSKTASYLAFSLNELGGLKMANPLRMAVKPTLDFMEWAVAGHAWLMLILSVVLTFYMLFMVVKVLRSLVLERVEAFFDTYIFKTAFRAFLFGAVLTVMVQSSSVTTSLVVPLAGAGILTLVQIFPYTIGANVGTTITANLAALSTGNPVALSVSFAHLLFNLIGGLMIYPVRPIRNIPLAGARYMAVLAKKNRFIPVLFILFFFYFIPILVILLEGGFHA